MLLESYDGLLGQAKTINDLNRINIAFGNTMTPPEVVELGDALFVPGYRPPPLHEDRAFSDDQLKATSRAWIEEMLDHLKVIGKAGAEPFGRRDVRKSVTLYTDGKPPAGKTLIVALPGANHRLMMPTASLLQALPADRVDIALIRDGTRSAYHQGLEGVADTMSGLADALPEMLRFSSYEQISGLGVSAGGLPIVLIALRLGFAAVLDCGGNSPHDERWASSSVSAPAATLKAFAAKGFSTRVTLAYGEQMDADRTAAFDTAECLGIEPLAVTNSKGRVVHNILHPLAVDGRLPEFLAEHLGY